MHLTGKSIQDYKILYTWNLSTALQYTPPFSASNLKCLTSITKFITNTVVRFDCLHNPDYIIAQI